nr:ADP-ribosylglycohydrolase family protein [Streptomyces sp. NBC_00886]
MSCSVVAVLAVHHRIDQDALARSFAEHHDFDRGYGPAVNRLLRLVREGGDWRELSAGLFNGQGSWGNGAAMRIAPLGAWSRTTPNRRPTRRKSPPTPRTSTVRPWAGAMAVAAAAALAAAPGGPPSAGALLDGVIALVPKSAVGAGLRRARDMLDYADAGTVATVLGCGRPTTTHDTVPFALWSAARGLGDHEQRRRSRPEPRPRSKRRSGFIRWPCGARTPPNRWRCSPSAGQRRSGATRGRTV